ncbi:MAG: AAA family ATPase, partial [Candidatus Omnitrophica bacterium]|nr:AAA family ATPase [Candidatus Omnitrophota bacterium]
MGQIISLFSPKGGVGRTFLTTNLAVSISGLLAGKKILLLDMDFDLPGDMSKLLNIHPTKALVDLVPQWEKNNYTPALLKEYTHNFSDTLDFMPVILKVPERSLLKSEFLQKILEDLKDIKGPKLLHVLTKKGKGFEAAENNQTI